jgi:hypothetical protein
MKYARPSVDDLINNVPCILKSSRQFLAWNLERGEKKVPLTPDGHSWGDYKDPNCWRTFNDALDLLDRRRAFGIGLVLPSPQQIKTLSGFNLIPGLVAFDGDAKRSSMSARYSVPAHISDYVRSAKTYSEFSPSLKGLRALAFGTIPTEKQNITKHFGDGTELSLYRGGWVTLSGLPFGGSSATIEHRQQAIDRMVAELWPELVAGDLALNEPVRAALPPLQESESFILDRSRSVSEERIRQFIQGRDRTADQLSKITATWEMKRGWNHGNTPDSSMYTKRIVEEALRLRPLFSWTMQDVVDILITFCNKHQLQWSFGRAKRQIADGQRYVSRKTCQRGVGGGGDCTSLVSPTHTPTLTCIGSQINREHNHGEELASNTTQTNDLPIEKDLKSRDTFGSQSRLHEAAKLSRHFRHRSVVRDDIIDAVKQYRGWVKTTTIAAKVGVSLKPPRSSFKG